MKHKKQSVAILVGVISLLGITCVFLFSLLGRITQKMDQGANETLLNSTRMIQSSLDNELQSDEQQLETCAHLFAKMNGPEDPVETLRNFTAATEFYRFSYVDLTGAGMDNTGTPVSAADFPFEERALSHGGQGYSDAYVGGSGRLQITFQIPVLLEGKQVGALYADKTLTRYNSPALFTFSGGSGRAYVVRSGDGSWIIESTGTSADDLYGFLEQNGNDAEVQTTLRQLMLEGDAGTIGVQYQGEDSLLCFLPLENDHDWYLISILPKIILQQESSEIMQMIRLTLVEVVLALFLITLLLLSRQMMKNREKIRAYREQLFQIISSNVDFAFLLYSPEKRSVEMISDNVQFLFDLSPEEVSAKPEHLFNHCGIPVDDPVRDAFFNGHLSEKIRREYQMGTANELQRWTEVHLIPVDGGQYLAVLHDTTPEHHMRDDLGEALRQSQESNRARTAFFSSMSHDIRTPMNGIIGMTAIAQANLDNPAKVEDCLQKISVASDHLLSLINEVLDMSRIESGKISLKQEPVNLPGLISNVLLLIKPELTKKKHTIHIKSTVLDYDTVIGDALHIQKILLNLLSNAVKYTPDGGNISVLLRERPLGDGRIEVLFQVQDNGVGMDADFLTRIFDPFARAEDNRVSKVAGSGLGMAITKNIVDLMGGTISVESTPGVGSTFTVSLPLSLTEQKAGEESALYGRTVLVVDDDRTICEGVQVMLEGLGLRVDYSLCGRDGVEQVHRAHDASDDYFAVIMDWKMPEMDGIEATRRIRADFGREIPVILLSAYNWEDVEQEALDAGVNGFLTKPIFRSELVQKLRHFSVETTPQPHQEAAAAALPKEHFDGLRVLLVEDNELNREIAEELLRGSGIQVESAENGLLAVQRVEERGPGYYGMIFMDIHMPVMDGLKATEMIRRLPQGDASTIPIIAMTANAFDEDVQMCKAAGMDAHIPKPIDVAKLFQVIGQYWKKESGAMV